MGLRTALGLKKLYCERRVIPQSADHRGTSRSIAELDV